MHILVEGVAQSGSAILSVQGRRNYYISVHIEVLPMSIPLTGGFHYLARHTLMTLACSATNLVCMNLLTS